MAHVRSEYSAPAGRSTHDDEVCVARMASGDAKALASLYDVHGPAMLALARRILADALDAEDLVHDVFLEAWQRAGSYAPSRGSVRSWLLIRVRSRAIDRLRSLGAARRAGLTARRERAETVPAPKSRLPGECRRARNALAALSQLQRDVVDLAYFGGLSCREIAEHYSIPEGTAKSRLAAALRSLRDAVAKPGESDEPRQ